MEKLNLPPFYVGQKVVYIGVNNAIKDKIFKVLNVLKFDCGCYKIDIGMKFDLEYKYTRCISCDKPTQTNDNVFWYASYAFAPLQQQSFPLIKLSKIMEKEKEEILIPN